MPATVFSSALVGIEAAPIEVEADISQGLPNFCVVGLPDAAVQEARERVRAALRNTGLSFPRTRLTVNLAPADVKKEGCGFDLPIAIALLQAGGVLPSKFVERPLFVGELALDGTLRPIPGALAIAAMAARYGFSQLYIPSGNAAQAALVTDITVIPVPHLRHLVEHLIGNHPIAPQPQNDGPTILPRDTDFDFSYIRGQEQAKRALEIAAAGGHNVLMSGPPGSGKTLLARSLPSILPDMTRAEALEVTQIHSVAGVLPPTIALLGERPFRAPHHTASGAALVGGGTSPRPGEVSLAHRGVLFLDELPEFSRNGLEALRQPLEDGAVTISRAAGSVRFPAKFMLVAAQNPCPCGYAGDLERPCSCPTTTRERYERKVSGPLLDRIDLHLSVPRMPTEKLANETAAESSFDIRSRVAAARLRQQERFAQTGLFSNSEIPVRLLKNYCPLDPEPRALLLTAVERFRLSARAWSRVLRISRTIADLSGEARIANEHIAEALQYRPKVE